MAYKMPCLSRMCCQLGVQMGTPEQSMPGLLQCTDGKSTGGHSRVSGARARTVVGLVMEVAGGSIGLQNLFSPWWASAVLVSLYQWQLHG